MIERLKRFLTTRKLRRYRLTFKGDTFKEYCYKVKTHSLKPKDVIDAYEEILLDLCEDEKLPMVNTRETAASLSFDVLMGMNQSEHI